MSTIINGVEYAQMPIPSELWRATKYANALDLIKRGVLYLSSAQKYRTDPDPERGDATETDGRFIRQGVTCTTVHTNPIFLWCTTLDPDPESVLGVWRDYDTVIHIDNPQALAERMLKAAKTQGVDGVSFHAGTPTYDKDQGGTAAYLGRKHLSEAGWTCPTEGIPLCSCRVVRHDWHTQREADPRTVWRHHVDSKEKSMCEKRSRGRLRRLKPTEGVGESSVRPRGRIRGLWSVKQGT